MKISGSVSSAFKKSLSLSLSAIFIALILLSATVTSAAADSVGSGKPDKMPEMHFYVLNVGQGDCSLFIFPNGQTMLIDAGTEDSGKGIVRYLKSCGVKKIDCLVATHPHSDHIGGMKTVIEKFKIGKIWDSGFILGSKPQKDFYITIKNKNIRFGRPKRGYSEKFGEVLVEVLAPAAELRNTDSDANNNCLVLLITYGKVSFLMAGDMEEEERRTIEPLPLCAVLKAAHHGSKNGTDMRMLRETSPIAVILSYGKDNSYGFPHKEVVLALSKMRIKRFDTVNGALKFRTDGISLTYPKNREVFAVEK
ncbi:MAG: MBL fold metallo-hydrolase [Synergistaceae bacterium]|nr:MBL fold metallo-hydrolase [Synergistaceae bacterium]